MIKINNGFVALTSVLVISFLVLSVATSISLLGIGEAKSAADYESGRQALKIAEGCVNEAMLRLRDDATYTGTSSPISFGNGECTIAVSGTGASRAVAVEATVTDLRTYRKRLEVGLSVAGNSVNINNWAEVY